MEKRIFLNPGKTFNCPTCNRGVIACLHGRDPIYYNDTWQKVVSKSSLKTITGGNWGKLTIPYENNESKCSHCKTIIFENFVQYPKMDLPDDLFKL